MQDFHESFAPSAFDLVFSDECHRSIYDRWEPVISYFDARLVGLTATPADFIARSTFAFFGLPSGNPTFAYELDQAVKEGYLAPYQAYHARTKIQIEGVFGPTLPEPVRKRLADEGIDPADIDFEGSDLERRVTNDDTTRLLVEEFVEQAITSSDGQLPGKSIIFAISHAHAKRLWEMFARLYPQWPGLAEIIDSHMERTDQLLKAFKTEDLPRVAISVDMLDTGVDVPTVVNLGLMKPVFSRIKFWQMIGRGTRLVDEDAAKPWCAAGAKTHFRVLDFWGNFERFQLAPEGAEPSLTTPAPTRLFRLLLRASASLSQSAPPVAQGFQDDARAMVDALPTDGAGVRENRALLEDVRRDAFWAALDSKKRQLLSLEIAPLLRFLPSVDLPACTLRSEVLECAIAVAEADTAGARASAKRIQAAVVRLPVAHSDVAPYIPLIRTIGAAAWPEQIDLDAALTALDLAGLMRLRESEGTHVIHLALDDVFEEQRWISIGPGEEAFELAEYRALVEARVRHLADSHPAMLALATGQPLSDGDLAAIEASLEEPDLFITEETLKKAYDAPHGSLVSLLRHALGIEELQPRADAIRAAFEAFVTEKSYLDPEQILFVRLFASRLNQAGVVAKGDLLDQPFTLLGSGQAPISEDDLDDLFRLAGPYEVA
jgi:type I restriction enzyme, R subunit